MIYDMKQKKFVEEKFTGICGQMSFARLQDIMRRAGEISENEKISHFEIQSNGMISFGVEVKSNG